MGYLPTSERFDVPTFRRYNDSSIYPLSFHTLGHSFALFCTPRKLNSFIFKRFRTLRQKTTSVTGKRYVMGSSSSSLWPPCLRVKLSDCVSGACPDPVGALIPILSFDLQLSTLNLPTLALSPLDATFTGLPASVANKRLTSRLSLLDATYKKLGGGGREAIR
jgi:hypothetical protein